MNHGHRDEIGFRTERVSSRQLWGQAWGILWPQYFWITLGICVVGMIVGGAAPMAVLMGPMMCGIFICFFAMMDNESPTFAMLFKGFDFFIDSLVATLGLAGLPLVIAIPGGSLFFFGLTPLGGVSKPSTRGSVTDDPARVLHATFGLVGCLRAK